MKTVIDLGEGIVQIKVPLPFPLLWVNAYAVRGTDGWTVIDPGLRTPQAEERWEEAASSIGLEWKDVTCIVLTHHHPDHYGMTGWMQERSKAPVYCTGEARRQAESLWGEKAEETASAILDLFTAHGLPGELAGPMRDHLHGFIAWVSPQPADFRTIRPGDTFRIGDANYEALLTEGHAAGHLSFLNRENGRIFCGDHVLPGITPNVSYIPGGDMNPLRTFLLSLAETEKLPVSEALPGHRDPFRHYAERCAAIRKHHDERLERMKALRELSPDAYAICRSLFGDKLSVHQLRFALSETIAHLIYMES
ncbi:MBL fold metallo-hydrolase [Paenibacillus thermotolerans]|uniref:MBL fold metallo-hydrolase n=1 Tax=Paenibacillus thermotolerans TaxID=3027807 RepID=UPI002368A836|nr:MULTISPECIES: MBL fold metallo-hydrolase [unclassified Paenibacillus]